MISRSRSLAAAVALLSLALVGGCGRGGGAGSVSAGAIRRAAAGRNILVVVLDAAARDHFGCYGYHRDTTPYLDRIAAQSVVFENAYAQATGTMLSVFSYFTSRYPVFGQALAIHEDMVLTLPGEMTTLAEVMGRRFPERLGCTCNTWLDREQGYAQGFTEWWQLWDLPFTSERGQPRDIDLIPFSLEWMAENADDGFFAYLHFMKPHSPFDPPEPFLTRFAEGRIRRQWGEHGYLQSLLGKYPGEARARAIVALYDGNLAYIDEVVGRMIEDLRSRGVWDRTTFVLMADHGEAFWEHGTLRGHGGLVYEVVARVPFFIRVPGLPGVAGRRINEPVELVDLLPTLMDLAGIPAGQEELAGRSLVPLMAGEEPEGQAQPVQARTVFTRTNRRDPAIFAARRGDLKLIHDSGTGRRELYDLARDPGEKADLLAAGQAPPEAEVLWRDLQAWVASGSAQGTVAASLPAEALDPAARERLRALGYVE